jgi:hypothetical protein
MRRYLIDMANLSSKTQDQQLVCLKCLDVLLSWYSLIDLSYCSVFLFHNIIKMYLKRQGITEEDAM